VVTKELQAKKPRITPKTGRKPRVGKPRKKGKKAKAKWKVSPWLVGGGILLIVAAVLFPYIIHSGRLATTGAKVPAEARRFCLDLSHHNEGIQWDSLKVLVDGQGYTCKDLLKARHVYPVTTVIMKATEGERMVDKRYKEYWKESGKRDYIRGAYHFFRSSKDPYKQARLFESTVRLSHKDLPPVLDVETIHEGCPKEELNRKVSIWLGEIERHYGKKPIVYTSDSFARDILSPEITDHYPMWIARYNKHRPVFEEWTMWQFTDKALVYGATGYVDLSVIKQHE